MYDIVLCILPFVNIDHIYSGPAVLKGVLNQHGFKVRTVDFGCELFKLCDRNTDKLYQIQNYFLTAKDCDDPEDQLIVDSFYKLVINFFQEHPSKFIGISVFTQFTHKATYELLSKIKEHNINSKIVIGGRGVKRTTWDNILGGKINLTSLEKTLFFSDLLKKKKLIDYVIVGDGEEEIIKLLNNTETFNNTVTDNYSEAFRTPVADYSDYNFDDYVWYNEQLILPIIGSKGCVRACDFCDTGYHLGRYRVRSGVDVANEMIELSQRWNVRKFTFADNLVNGSVTAFVEFIKIIADYNEKNPSKKLTWSGNYICRPPEFCPEEMYSLIAKSGGEGLVIGAESGSNRVLAAMNKKTTVEALYLELEQFRKNNITCVLLTFVGHWSEEWEDFLEHCKMLIKIAPYLKSGTISTIHLGYTMAFLHGSPADENSASNQIVRSSFSPELVWKNKNNPTNTFKERIFRRLIITAIAEKLKIVTTQEEDVFRTFNIILNNYTEEINQFYENCN